MGIPDDNPTNYQTTLFLGLNSLQIFAAPYTQAAISMNNVLHGTGVADANGNLNLTLSLSPSLELPLWYSPAWITNP